jgi:hypothetical protein
MPLASCLRARSEYYDETVLRLTTRVPLAAARRGTGSDKGRTQQVLNPLHQLYIVLCDQRNGTSSTACTHVDMTIAQQRHVRYQKQLLLLPILQA